MTMLPFMLVSFLGMLSVTACDSNLSDCKLDLGLVIDMTRSVKEENIPKVKTVLKQLVQQLTISEDGTHVSLETFQKVPTLHSKFKDAEYYSQQAVMDLIDTKLDKLGKPTRLDLAIGMADEEMFTEGNGDRLGVRSVMLLFTDGRSHPDDTDVEKYTQDIKDIKSKGVSVVVVAVGPDAAKPKYRKVLDNIGGKNVFLIDEYEAINEASAVANMTELICPPKCESAGMDVAFLVDKTNSVGEEDFKLAKGFLLQLSDAMTIGPDATHTGYILFAGQPTVLNTFNDSKYHSGESVHRLIESIPVELGSRTYIDRALKAANERLFTEEGGDRSNFPNVLILLTDGRTNDKSESLGPIASALKDDKKVKIIAIGVGKYWKFMGELREIAGDNVYNATSFNELSDLFRDILEEACNSEPDSGSGMPEVLRDEQTFPRLRRVWNRISIKPRDTGKNLPLSLSSYSNDLFPGDMEIGYNMEGSMVTSKEVIKVHQSVVLTDADFVRKSFFD